VPKQILCDVEIRWPEALWVLGAHAYALLVPLAMLVAVNVYWDYLYATTYNPFLFYIAGALLCLGSAFEVAQNAIDRWYLTADSPSANGMGFSDFLFYWFVTAGQAVCAIAIGGDAPWVVLIALGAVLIYPVCYLSQVAHFAPLGIANFLAVYLAYQAFGDPIIFLQLLLAAVTLYFFEALLRTGAQVMHGFTTLTASSGVWFFVCALSNGAAGMTNSWIFSASIALVTVVAGIALWPALVRLPASPRIIRQQAVRA
jgi:hypothetical protein